LLVEFRLRNDLLGLLFDPSKTVPAFALCQRYSRLWIRLPRSVGLEMIARWREDVEEDLPHISTTDGTPFASKPSLLPLERKVRSWS
jgi:hypothetical protein